MANTMKELIPSKLAEDAFTTQYEARGCTAVINRFTAINVGDHNAHISVFLSQPDAAFGNATLIVKERQLAVNETYAFPMLSGHVLEEGTYITTISSDAGYVAIRCSGMEITR